MTLFGTKILRPYHMMSNKHVCSLVPFHSNKNIMNILEETQLFFGKLIGPHLSLKDLVSLRQVNIYFNEQMNQYIKYR